MKQQTFKLEGYIMALKHRFQAWIRERKTEIKYRAALYAVEYLIKRAVTGKESSFLIDAGIAINNAAQERGLDLTL